jgi:hypothetical protein
MPTGLLDRAGDRDIADLYAYLRSLTGKPRRRRRAGSVSDRRKQPRARG